MIYLDNNATSRVDPDVAKSIYDSMLNNWGNPSTLYEIGSDAMGIIFDARYAVAEFLGSDALKCLTVFTGSGSEANNLALTGLYKGAVKNSLSCAVYCSEIEHKSITNQPCVKSNIVVDELGHVDIERLKKLLDVSTLLNDRVVVSVQMANNEVGTIQNLKEISEVVHSYKNCILHSDVTQSLYLCRDILRSTKIDVITASLHKSHMPKGIGFVTFVNNDTDFYEKWSVEPIVYGGQQQYGFHAGTENVPYISAIPLCLSKLVLNSSIAKKRDYLWDKIQEKIDRVIVNGDLYQRLDNNLSVSFAEIDGESLLYSLATDGICVSTGSACNNESVEASHVLRAINVPEGYIYGTIRFSLGADTTYEDLDFVVDKLVEHVATLRDMSAEKALELAKNVSGGDSDGSN